MNDREKVIYSLERCASMVPDACRDCYYYELPNRRCVSQLAKDAQELLKEQETSYKECGKTFLLDGEIVRLYKCESCGYMGYNLEEAKLNYCPNCGRKVKWNDTD